MRLRSAFAFGTEGKGHVMVPVPVVFIYSFFTAPVWWDGWVDGCVSVCGGGFICLCPSAVACSL